MASYDKREYVHSPEGYRELAQKLFIGLDAMHEAIGTAFHWQLSESSEILIVGGGCGQEVGSLHTLSPHWNFTVVEPSQKALQLATYWAEKDGILERTKLLYGFLHENALPQAGFDAITCIAVLHYLEMEERKALLRHIRTLLKPNGVFAYTVAVEPDTQEEMQLLRALYKQFPAQNGVEEYRVNKILNALDTEYKMISAKEETNLLKSLGFQTPIQIFSTLFFKTYVVRPLNER